MSINKTIVFFFASFLTISCASNGSNENKTQQYLYEFKNSSLGPIEGHQVVKITIEQGKVIKATDMKTDKELSFQKIKGSSVFMRAIKHNNQGLKVKYDASGVPVSITNVVPKGSMGGKYHIAVNKITKGVGK